MRKIIVITVLAFLAFALLTACTPGEQIMQDAQAVGQAAADAVATANAPLDAAAANAKATAQAVVEMATDKTPSLTVTKASYDETSGLVTLEVTVWNCSTAPKLWKVEGPGSAVPTAIDETWEIIGEDGTGGVKYSTEFTVSPETTSLYFGTDFFSPFIGGMISDVSGGKGWGEDPANCGWKRNP